MTLSDACEINPGSQAISEETLVSFVAMPDVTVDGRINTNVIRPYGEVKKGYTVFREGDVLFAKITPCMENGKGALALGLRNGIGVGSTEFHILRPNPAIIDGMWLYYLTAWPTFRHEAEIHMTGSAGQKRVPKSFLEGFHINIPTLSEQTRQASHLNRIRRIIEARESQLNTFDNLIKARFVEMFGDPVTNPNGWLKLTVKEAVEQGYIARPLDGNHGEKHPKNSDYVSQGVPFLMAQDLKDKHVDFTHCHFITEKQAKTLTKGWAKTGDVLLTNKGTIGRVAIVQPSDYQDMLLTPQITYYRCLKEIDNQYLAAYFGTGFFINQLSQLTTGATRASVTITQQEKLELIIPPRDMQMAFVALVNQLDKSKVVVQKALDEAKLLFESLMQKYFG